MTPNQPATRQQEYYLYIGQATPVPGYIKVILTLSELLTPFTSKYQTLTVWEGNIFWGKKFFGQNFFGSNFFLGQNLLVVKILSLLHSTTYLAKPISAKLVLSLAQLSPSLFVHFFELITEMVYSWKIGEGEVLLDIRKTSWGWAVPSFELILSVYVYVCVGFVTV